MTRNFENMICSKNNLARLYINEGSLLYLLIYCGRIESLNFMPIQMLERSVTYIIT
jgi:hypothetical protein